MRKEDEKAYFDEVVDLALGPPTPKRKVEQITKKWNSVKSKIKSCSFTSSFAITDIWIENEEDNEELRVICVSCWDMKEPENEDDDGISIKINVHPTKPKLGNYYTVEGKISGLKLNCVKIILIEVTR